MTAENFSPPVPLSGLASVRGPGDLSRSKTARCKVRRPDFNLTHARHDAPRLVLTVCARALVVGETWCAGQRRKQRRRQRRNSAGGCGGAGGRCGSSVGGGRRCALSCPPSCSRCGCAPPFAVFPCGVSVRASLMLLCPCPLACVPFHVCFVSVSVSRPGLSVLMCAARK